MLKTKVYDFFESDNRGRELDEEEKGERKHSCLALFFALFSHVCYFSFSYLKNLFTFELCLDDLSFVWHFIKIYLLEIEMQHKQRDFAQTIKKKDGEE